MENIIEKVMGLLRKRWFWAVAVLLVLIVAAVCFFGFGDGRNFLMSKEAREGQAKLKEAQEMADLENFHFQINAKPVFENGQTEGPLMITNPLDNGYNMQVRIVLDDTKEEIYYSDVLKPGQRKGNVCLDKGLKKGKYAATAVFDVLDLETGESVGEVLAGVEVVVLN